LRVSKRIDYEGALSGVYARYRAASPRILGKLAAYASRYEAPRLVEVGCGTGDYAAALRFLVAPSGGEVSDFDKAQAMLEQARSKHPGLNVCQADAEGQWPLPDHCADLAFSVDVIHYIRDLDQYFGEARRVLRPGGMVVTVTDSEEDIAGRTITRFFPETVPHELARYHPVRRLAAAMGRAGFGPTGTDHTSYETEMVEASVERFRQRAYSSLRLIADEEYRRGLAKLEAAWAAGPCQIVELYTYCWGVREGA